MKKYILLCLCLLASIEMMAGNGDEYISLKSGFLFAKTGNFQVSYERDLDYETSVELIGEVGQKILTAGQSKDYYWAAGIGYKTDLKRYKNSELRLTTEAHGGAHTKNFFFGAGIGLEYAYVFQNGVQFIVQQKNQLNFLNNGTFKHGLIVGFKFPL